MIKLYTNRELADIFKINLAKWKRWSREFLLPDPLAGMQSGFARQYYIHDVFTIYLGGHLVAELKFSIAEAKQILQDLDGWLDEKGHHFNPKGILRPREGVARLVRSYSIFIREADGNGLSYRIRGTISSKPVVHEGFQVQEERYVETWIASKGWNREVDDMNREKVLHVTGVFNDFKKKIEDLNL